MKIIIGFMLLVGTMSLSIAENDITETIEATQKTKIDTFTFSSNGTDINGKIYLPASFSKEKSLPAIYLIDFTEQHFRVATDEFERVIDGVQQIQGFDALVVTLEKHLNIDATPGMFQKYYDIYKNMTAYVDVNYTNNTSRTFIGRGSEAGIVLMTLFLEDSETSLFENFVATDSPSSFNSVITNMISNNDFPKTKLNKKLHFSFSTSNNRASCTNTIKTINDAQYPWLQFESLEYTNSNYENTYPAAFSTGLKYIFNNFSTGLEENLSTVTKEYRLEQNYPNPFNPVTNIKFYLVESGPVTIQVYNIQGKIVSTLVNQAMTAGEHTITFNASNLASGIYFYKMQTPDFQMTKKLMLIK